METASTGRFIVYDTVLAPPVPQAPPLAPPTAADRERGLFDLLLRGQDRLTALLTDERELPGIIQQMLGLSVFGMAVHGLVVGLAAQFLAGCTTHLALGHAALWMPLAFPLAFLGAVCICLPSFYFYTQLAGLDASFRLVTAQALRAQATTSVLLLGVLPFYAAIALTCAVGIVDQADLVLLAGMALPFLTGLFGISAVHDGFLALARVLPITHARRGNVLGRLVLCWGAVYSVIAPVALYRISEALQKLL